jgi:hypothetical protein
VTVTDDGKSAADVAEQVFAKLVDKLDGAAKVQAGRDKPLFFPDGIELIYLSVTVSGVTATIKIAGAKGVAASEVGDDVMSADPDPA